MGSFREFLERKPMLGWAVAAVIMLVAAAVLIRQVTRASETTQLTEIITIRCAETGDTWQLPRGVVEKELYLRPYPLDPNQGLINPKTGKPTGFPIDAWKETVTRINAERGADEAPGQPAKPPPPPRP